MPLDKPLFRIHPRLLSWAKRPDRVAAVYVAFLLSTAVYYFATWPIVAGDQDLWYHLAGGRYLFESGEIPRTSFFSFITPERSFVDYYWLFQVVAYRLYDNAGYVGLIALRTALYGLAVFLIARFYLKGRRESYAVVYAVLLAIFTFLVIVPRELAVRPHIFSYLLTILFVYLIQFRPRRLIWALPLFAALWVNLHGVEYPVMVLIVGAYLMEELWRKGRAGGAGPWGHAALMGLSLIVVLATPYGAMLLPVPFTATTDVAGFIHELKPLDWRDFMSFFGLLFLLGCAAAVAGLARKRMRLSHLLLFVGALILLSRGKRFISEFVLLAMPLLRDNIPLAVGQPGRRAARWAAVVAIGVFAIVPFVFLHQFFWNTPRYPFSGRDLPLGTAAFIMAEGGGGTVFNHPNHGGYLQWALYPRHRIYMDLQLPFLFTYDDFRAAHDAFVNPKALKGILDAYRPAFIVAPIETTVFGELVKQHPDYRLVFFDDWTVVYADRRQHPEVVRRFELTAVDPYTLTDEALRNVPSGRGEQFERELRSLVGLFPEAGLAGTALAMRCLGEGRFADASSLADRVIASYPESFTGYKIKGDALQGLGHIQEASAALRAAYVRSPSAMRALIAEQQSSLPRAPARDPAKVHKSCSFFDTDHGPNSLNHWY